ncbi:MAG: hypothetical protein ACPGUV_12510, partial [Polyangiales bacterium]
MSQSSHFASLLTLTLALPLSACGFVRYENFGAGGHSNAEAVRTAAPGIFDVQDLQSLGSNSDIGLQVHASADGKGIAVWQNDLRWFAQLWEQQTPTDSPNEVGQQPAQVGLKAVRADGNIFYAFSNQVQNNTWRLFAQAANTSALSLGAAAQWQTLLPNPVQQLDVAIALQNDRVGMWFRDGSRPIFVSANLSGNIIATAELDDRVPLMRGTQVIPFGSGFLSTNQRIGQSRIEFDLFNRDGAHLRTLASQDGAEVYITPIDDAAAVLLTQSNGDLLWGRFDAAGDFAQPPSAAISAGATVQAARFVPYFDDYYAVAWIAGTAGARALHSAL